MICSWLETLKLLQNKKGQKNLGYPRKNQSFYKEKDCFFLGYPNFFGPSYFEAALENKKKMGYGLGWGEILKIIFGIIEVRD